MSTYSLSFATSLSGDKAPWQFSFNTGKEVSVNSVKFNVQLTHLSFLKEVYHPCFVRATLSVTLAQSSIPTQSQLKALADALAKRSVSLSFDNVVIGTDYLLFDATPSVRYNDSSSPSSALLSLDIYSRDKLLTLDKFSKSYLSHKLGDDILKGSLGSAKPLGAYKVNESHKNIDHLIGFLDAAHTTTVEVRQPYLVQYQEPFYNFVARVANRCGEMLFFEDGQLTLGLRSKTPITIPINAIASLSLASCPHRPLSKKVAPPFFYDYQKHMSKPSLNASSNAIPIQLPKSANNDAATIEFETNNITTPTFSFLWDDDAKNNQPSWITYISVEPSIKPFVRYLHIGVAENNGTTKRAVSIAIIANYYVRNGKKMVPTKKTLCTVNVTQTPNDAPCADFSSDANKSVSKEALPFVIDFANDELYELIEHLAPTPASGSAVANACIKAALTKFFNNQVPFKIFPNIDILLSLVMTVSETYAKATADANYKRNDHNNKFYSKAKNITFNYNVNEQKKDSAAKNTDPNDPFSPFFTKLADANSNLFAAFYDTVRRYADVAQRGRIRIFLSSPLDVAVGNIVSIPSLGSQRYIVIAMRGSSSPLSQMGSPTSFLSFDAVPLDSSGFAFPPLYPCSVSPVVKPQPAFVVYNDDCKFGPNDLGRVSVRYPWQPEVDPPTPWLRIALPFATNGGACFFKPEVDDEVMIDYIGGNIERPFVAGALFNARNTKSKSSSDSRYFCNTTGQYIAFQSTKPFLTSTLASVVPLLDFIFRFIPSIDDKLSAVIKADVYKNMSGKLTLSDKFGFWSISGDTAARNVTVSSTYGAVSISAFTGISFSAPRGNIDVFAKNILIQASNNVVIQSGRTAAAELNKNSRYNKASYFTKTLNLGVFEPLARQLTKGIDMSLIRTIFNVFNPSVEGTLHVSSHRFLNFEASDSTAILDPAEYYKSMDLPADIICSICKFVDGGLLAIKKKYKCLQENDTNSSVPFSVIKKDNGDSNDNNVNDNQNDVVGLSQDNLKGLKTLINSFIHPPKRIFYNSDAHDCLTSRAINGLLKEPFGDGNFDDNDDLKNRMHVFFDDGFFTEKLKEFKRKLVYQIISSNNDKYSIVPGTSKPTSDNEWRAFVNAVSVKLPEKNDDNVFLSYVCEKLSTAKGLISATIKTPNTETYNWAFNDKGQIIFSNKAANSENKDVNVSWTFDDNGKLKPASTLTDVDEMTERLRAFLRKIT